MNKVAVGDADALIALAYNADLNHQRALDASTLLKKEGYTVIFPNTAILEAITALKRSLNQPARAHVLNLQYQQGAFSVEYVGREIHLIASKIFDSAQSKKNTIFDAIVAATAQELGSDTIFSFDSWYPKLGFKLL